MTPEYTNQLATQLLLSGLATVLALGIASCLVIVYIRRTQAARVSSFKRSARDGVSGQQDPPVYQPCIFEQTCRWLVVKSSQVRAVQTALGLHNATPCSWGEGMSQLTPRKLFVSPPVRGWILVIGQGLPDPSDDVDHCFHFLCKLSRALGQVQFFSANRALNHHAWIRIDRGHIQRAYAWGGETLWNQGERTQAEMELGMKCLGYCERPPSIELGGAHSSNAEKVMSLAARWSFDPTAVSESMLRAGCGVAGELTQPRRR
jgi:hypothetical protein